MLKKSFYVDLISVILFLHLGSFVSCQEESEDSPVTIDPFRLTIEVGNDAVFTCSYTSANDFTTISWFYPDNVTQVDRESNTTRRVFVDDESKLHINSAQENDTGLYLCSVINYTNDTTVSGIIATTSTSPVTLLTNASTGHENEGLDRSVLTEATSYNATVYLNVYVMPTYFTEGMIILGINLGLLLIFLICLGQSLFIEKKRMRLYYKK